MKLSGIGFYHRPHARTEQFKELASTLRSELQRFQQQIQETSDREEIKILDEKMGTCIRLVADHAVPFLALATQARSVGMVEGLLSVW